MRIRSPRTPPPSSYSHAPHHTPDINVYDITSRIGLPQPEGPFIEPKPLSYISLLPPEILAEIFVHCIPEGQFPLPYRTEAPLLLTHVSSLWRSLAMSIPDLWTSLHINYKDPAEDIPAANTWLSLSGDRALSLSIAIDFSEQPQQGILDALCRHSKRWKHVRFEFRNLFCPPMYSLDMALNNIGELTTFEFYARDISTINVAPITNLLASAPKLREVTWVDDLADTDTLLQLPLGRLTGLSLSMDQGTLDPQVLTACYNLEHIRLTRPFSLTPHMQEPLFLPKLSSINISSAIAGVLDQLVLPALREVRIHGEHDRPQGIGHDASPTPPHHHLALSPTGTWDPTPLLALVQRSACMITSLSVSPPMTEAALLVCLRGMGTSLVSLCVEDIPVGDTLVQALTCRWGQQGELLSMYVDGFTEATEAWRESYDRRPLCPHLEELVLDTRVGCTPGMLANMVESRIPRSERQDHTDGGCVTSMDFAARTREDRMSSLRLIKVVGGHKDLQRLKALSSLSKNQIHAARAPNGSLTVSIIPRKATKPHTRDFCFRRKLCASR